MLDRLGRSQSHQANATGVRSHEAFHNPLPEVLRTPWDGWVVGRRSSEVQLGAKRRRNQSATILDDSRKIRGDNSPRTSRDRAIPILVQRPSQILWSSQAHPNPTMPSGGNRGKVPTRKHRGNNMGPSRVG